MTRRMILKPWDDTEATSRFREGLMYQDLAFKRAVLAARKAGLERVALGVVIDDTPIPPSYKRYDLSPPIIVSQSIAGECADVGRSYGQ
jgi:hypothetical protein